MSIAHLLEDFGTAPGMTTLSISDTALEDERIESYESGYKAGWQDAVKAAAEDADRVASDFAGNLQDISFTLAEAQRDLLASLRPLLTGMVQSVLPHLARRTIGDHVIQTLESMAEGAMKGPLHLVTSPGNAEALQTLVDERGLSDTSVEIEPSLGEGQVHIKAAGGEQEIDLDAVLQQIDAALTGFFEDHQKDIA